MKIDKAPFPVHTIDLNNAKVLIRPDQAEGAKGRNVIIGDERPLTVDNKILAREVIQEKTPDGKKSLRIILKPRTLGGGGKRVLLQATGLLLSRDRSSRSVRKWVHGRPTSQRCKARLQIRSLPLANS